MMKEKAILIACILVGTLVLAFVSSYLIKFISRKKPSRSRQIILLIATTAKLTILIVGILSALGTAGVDISPIIAALGLTGFALGFALKDAISNLLAGVMIVIYSPFEVGDEIEIQGCRGIVEETNLRYTVLAAADKKYMIPNSNCFTNTIIHHNKAQREKPQP